MALLAHFSTENRVHRYIILIEWEKTGNNMFLDPEREMLVGKKPKGWYESSGCEIIRCIEERDINAAVNAIELHIDNQEISIAEQLEVK